ncbi:MAG: hypothetical protein GWP19_15210 [Planctomycetia bacterium]|nr:hypothetical protein [Planctomycetia bacterium]
MAKKTGAFHIARQLFDSEIWTNKPATWNKIWIYILGQVKYNDTDKFKRGECFFNFSRERKDIGIDITEDMIKKCLTYLRKSGMIRTLRSTRGTIVKVLNYNYFQTLENYASTTPSTREAREKHEPSTPILKEVKKERNIYSTTIQEIVATFYSTKQLKHKNAIKVNDQLALKSCETIDKLNRIDEVPLDYIKKVITRSITDEFWKDQIMSLSGLRKKKDGVMKFINCANSVMKSGYVPEPTKKLIAYRFECPGCGEKTGHREKDPTFHHRCKQPGCQKEKLGFHGEDIVGYVLNFKENIYKDIS